MSDADSIGQTKQRRRGRLEMYLNVLSSATSVATKTRICYSLNTNYTVTKKYIKELIDRGFMQEVDNNSGQPNYVPTQKGLMLVHLFDDGKAREMKADQQNELGFLYYTTKWDRMRRNKYDIKANILRIIKEQPETKTRIASKTRTNHTLVRSNMEKLISAGMVSTLESPDRKGKVHTHYKPTQKGLDYLEKYEEVVESFRELDVLLKDL